MPKLPPFSPTVMLLTCAASWEAALADALKPLGLTTRKYALLGHIQAAPGLSFSELARRSRITTPSVHSAVSVFAADGWVEDATSRAGAASRLRVTPVGERLLAEAGQKVAALDAEFTATNPGIAEALRERFLETVGRPEYL
ncbi:MarR family winged helix-turn-helix transcriptional regulator [Kocuria sp. U4B]